MVSSGIIIFTSTQVLDKIWFLVPVLKYLDPNIGFADDFRHIMESLYPFLLFAAIGLNVMENASNWFLRALPLQALLPSFLVVYLVLQVYSVHPYEISYYSDLIGGLRGAQGKFDIEQFGISSKAAALELNQIAPPDSLVYIPIAAVTAMPYLRTDLNVITDFHNVIDRKPTIHLANYVMILNREGLFDIYDPEIRTYLQNRIPIKAITKQGVPLVWIFEN